MTHFKRLILAAAVAAPLASSGCLTITPVGIMAEQMGTRPPPKRTAEGAIVTAAANAPAGPVMQAAPPPPAPTFRVTPGEVTAETSASAVARLQEEIEADLAALGQFPNYAEVSTVKR